MKRILRTAYKPLRLQAGAVIDIVGRTDKYAEIRYNGRYGLIPLDILNHEEDPPEQENKAKATDSTAVNEEVTLFPDWS